MTVRIGEIDLPLLQDVEVDEGRNLVEHRVPGSSGSVFQDLGRGAIRVRLVGLLLGDEARDHIETLRTAHAEAEPLQFSGDIAVGSELTDVIIEDFRVRQEPGHVSRYSFSLQIREWQDPPEQPGLALANVDDQIADDAAGWSDSAEAIGGALDDPGGLAALISGDGSLLARIDMSELAQAVIGALGGLDPSDFAHLLAAVTGVDPDLLTDFIEALADADSLGDVFDILLGSGIDLLSELTGIDLEGASALVQAFVGGPEFIDRLEEVRDAAAALLATIQDFDPLGDLEALAPTTGGSP